MVKQETNKKKKQQLQSRVVQGWTEEPSLCPVCRVDGAIIIFLSLLSLSLAGADSRKAAEMKDPLPSSFFSLQLTTSSHPLKTTDRTRCNTNKWDATVKGFFFSLLGSTVRSFLSGTQTARWLENAVTAINARYYVSCACALTHNLPVKLNATIIKREQEGKTSYCRCRWALLIKIAEPSWDGD